MLKKLIGWSYAEKEMSTFSSCQPRADCVSHYFVVFLFVSALHCNVHDAALYDMIWHGTYSVVVCYYMLLGGMI